MLVRRFPLVPALVLALGLSAVGPARAQPPQAPPPSDAESAARQLGEEALRRFGAGRWQEAHDLFQRADKTLHAPTLVLYMAHCQARLGNLLAARRLYRSVAAEPLPADAPFQFQTAQVAAREQLRSIRKRIFVLKVSIAGVPAEKARVLVDDIEVPAAEVAELGLDPGSHVIEVSVAGSPPVRKQISAVAGGTAELLLLSPGAPAQPRYIPTDVEADVPKPAAPKGASSAPPAAPKGASSAPPEPPPVGLMVPAGIAFGLGGGALVAGAITGAVSLGAASDVKSRCNAEGHCPVSDQPNAARAGRFADASTGLFIAGGAMVATGAILAVVHARQKRATLGRPALHLDIGLGHAALRGSF